MTCPTDLEKTVTQPHHIRAVTLSTLNGRVNVHLDDGLEVVYIAGTADLLIHQTIAQIAVGAYVNNLMVSITYEGGDETGSGLPDTYCKRNMTRITLEGNYDGELIPWLHREAP